MTKEYIDIAYRVENKRVFKRAVGVQNKIQNTIQKNNLAFSHGDVR